MAESRTLAAMEKGASEQIERAVALPFQSYTDKEVFQLEKVKIFHQDWVFICSAKELPQRGDYFAFFLAEEPVMLVHGDDDRIRAFGNICRHRGTLLNEEGFGNSPKMVCPYHAWTYDLQGKCIATPYAQKGEVEKQCHSLLTFKVEIWNELIFVNLSKDAAPLRPKLRGIEKYIQLFGVERFTETVGDRKSERWNANWKLALENAMESYHLFKVHSETLEKVTPTKSSFYLETSGDWTITGGKIEEPKKSFLSWNTDSDDIYSRYVLISLPPSFVGILSYESFDWITILPKNHQQCLVRAASRREPGYTLSGAEEHFVKTFLSEDKNICERVQSAMTAVYSTGGKLLNIEKVVVDFHNYLAARLFQSPSPKPYVSDLVEQFFE